MSNDLVNNKESEQQSSMTDQASKAFEESSVCAISAILSNDNKPRKIFRSVVFLIFTVAFFYQCIVFLCYIVQHPSLVAYEVLQDETFIAPAYTFCNFNPIKRSKYCAKYPGNCTKPNARFCDENPRFCGTPDTLIPKEEKLDFDNLDETFLLNHDAEEMSDEIDDEYKAAGPFPRLNSHEFELLVGACFTYNDRVNSPLDPFMKSRNRFRNGKGDRYRFDPEENEVIFPESKAGIMFQVHSPFEAVNPYETGYFMRPGYMYRITVKVTQEEKSNDCLNYTEVWLKNNKTGYRSQVACKEKCAGDIILECINCTELSILYPYPNVPFCGLFPVDSQTLSDICENPVDRVEECIKECKEECVKMKYSYEVKESYESRYARLVERNESRTFTVKLDFFEADLRKIIHKPEFQVFEVFSLIGGLLAFWIGLSMFQIVEIFDCVFQILKCLVKKRSAAPESSSA